MYPVRFDITNNHDKQLPHGMRYMYVSFASCTIDVIAGGTGGYLLTRCPGRGERVMAWPEPFNVISVDFIGTATVTVNAYAVIWFSEQPIRMDAIGDVLPTELDAVGEYAYPLDVSADRSIYAARAVALAGVTIDQTPVGQSYTHKRAFPVDLAKSLDGNVSISQANEGVRLARVSTSREKGKTFVKCMPSVMAAPPERLSFTFVAGVQRTIAYLVPDTSLFTKLILHSVVVRIQDVDIAGYLTMRLVRQKVQSIAEGAHSTPGDCYVGGYPGEMGAGGIKASARPAWATAVWDWGSTVELINRIQLNLGITGAGSAQSPTIPNTEYELIPFGLQDTLAPLQYCDYDDGAGGLFTNIPFVVNMVSNVAMTVHMDLRWIWTEQNLIASSREHYA